VSPEGFNLAQLQADLNAITNSPIPNPVIPTPPVIQTYWHVQVGGSFVYKPNAQKLINQLINKRINAYFGSNSIPYKVWCGNSTNKNEIIALQKKLISMGLATLLVSNQA
jgi:hypothetical protein